MSGAFLWVKWTRPPQEPEFLRPVGPWNFSLIQSAPWELTFAIKSNLEQGFLAKLLSPIKNLILKEENGIERGAVLSVRGDR